MSGSKQFFFCKNHLAMIERKQSVMMDEKGEVKEKK
jgi:hypothetical protein